LLYHRATWVVDTPQNKIVKFSILITTMFILMFFLLSSFWVQFELKQFKLMQALASLKLDWREVHRLVNSILFLFG